MSVLAHLGAVATTLTVLSAAFIAAALLLGAWIGAVADLIWIVVLRPRLAAGVILVLALTVLFIVYGVLPQSAKAPLALPMLVVVLIVPIAARALLHRLARALFIRRGGPFKLDRASLNLADVFILEDLRLRSLYKAPVSERPAP